MIKFFLFNFLDNIYLLSKHGQYLIDEILYLSKKIRLNNLNCIQKSNYILIFTIFILSCIVGYYIILQVTPSLHTPLMSITNAISGIVIVSALLSANIHTLNQYFILGMFAVFVSTINIFGGFVLTERMLEMFKKNKKK